MIRKHSTKGQSALELALLLPVLFLLFFGAVQIIIYIQSSTATQYAAFVAARSFQVYGDRTLGEIQYRKVASYPKTNTQQTAVEAAAEMVIFESLLWENARIHRNSSIDLFNRVYEDGNDVTYNATNFSSGGAVKVNLLCSNPGGCEDGQGVEVTYCAPFVFPGTEILFSKVGKENPCKVERFGKSYGGLALSKKVLLGREPLEK